MPIDKSWIDRPRNTPEYANGLKKFLDFAFQHQSIGGHEIKCPCSKCGCSKWQTRDIVQEHLTCKPFPKNYKVWHWHGEKSNVEALENTRVMTNSLHSQNPMETMINDAFGFARHNWDEPVLSPDPLDRDQTLNEEHNGENVEFYELLKCGNQQVYEGCTKYGKKWKEHRLKLWNKFYDPRLSRNENIRNVPKGINEEQWALFVDYRLKPSTKELCKRNQVIRNKQTIPQTTGAKSLAWRRAELVDETGREVCRGELWKLTNKKKDGNYINEEAKEIAEKIDDNMSQDIANGFEISPTNAVGKVFRKEHPRRVQGLGMGVVPTVAFKRTTTCIGSVNMGSCSASTSSQELKQKLVTMESQIQALCAYIAMKEGGRMPKELATFFPNLTSQVPDIGSRPESPNDKISSNGSNNNPSTNQLSPRT